MVHSGRFRLKSGGMQSCACSAFWFSRAMCLVFIMQNTIQTECSTRNSASFLCMACVCTSFAPFGNPSLCLLARALRILCSVWGLGTSLYCAVYCLALWRDSVRRRIDACDSEIWTVWRFVIWRIHLCLSCAANNGLADRE